MIKEVDIKQTRDIKNKLETREEQGELYLEGYFAVFNSETELWAGAFEEIDQHAFDNTLSNDIRALINHDTTLVLGRNKANTLELKVDSYGLWGKIRINQNDTDAMNLYQRVKRGDISGNSIGFNIINEETQFREDGTIKWILKEIDLHEVSVVTFPAYKNTQIQARQEQYQNIKKRELDARKQKVKERLKNAKTFDVAEKN